MFKKLSVKIGEVCSPEHTWRKFLGSGIKIGKVSVKKVAKNENWLGLNGFFLDGWGLKFPKLTHTYG